MGLDPILASSSAQQSVSDRRLNLKFEIVALNKDPDITTAGQLAEQQFVSQRLIDLLSNQPAHRSCTHGRIVTVLGQPASR